MKIFPLPFMYCSNLSCKFSRQTQKKLVGFSHYGHFSSNCRKTQLLVPFGYSISIVLWLPQSIVKSGCSNTLWKTISNICRHQSFSDVQVRVRKFRTLKTLRTRTQRVCLFTHLYCKEVNISQKNSEISIFSFLKSLFPL
jgi:hypothetical protein